MNKRGLDYGRFWAEVIALVLLIVGFIISLSAGSLVMAYLIAALSGMMFGRVWYRCRKALSFTWFLITLGFVVGFIIGNMYGSDLIILILFLAGLLASYYLHAHRIIESVEY